MYPALKYVIKEYVFMAFWHQLKYVIMAILYIYPYTLYLVMSLKYVFLSLWLYNIFIHTDHIEYVIKNMYFCHSGLILSMPLYHSV